MLAEGQRQPADDDDGGGGGGRREERRRSTVERGGRVVERALRHAVHRSPSTLAEDVVVQALRGVGRHLLTKGDDGTVRQTDPSQSRYLRFGSRCSCSVHNEFHLGQYARTGRSLVSYIYFETSR